MNNENNSQNKPEYELVFAITLHPVLGYLIEAFAALRNNNDQFEYGFKKVVKSTLWDYFTELPEPQRILMDKLHELSDEQLHKRFGSRASKIIRFYELLENEYVVKHIRPFIEKVLYNCVDFMIQHKMQIYFKGESGERIRETPLITKPKIAETCFHFERQADKTLYRLEVRYGEHDLFLYQKKARLITHKPCLLMHGIYLLRFEPSWDGKKLMPFFDKEFLVVPKSAEKQFFQKFVQKSILHHPFKALGFTVNILDQTPTPVLKMEEHWQGGVILGLYFSYADGTVFRMDDPAREKIKFREENDDMVFDKVVRNMSFEAETQSFLRSLNLTKIDGPWFSLFPTVGNALDQKVYNIEKQVSKTVDWFNANHQLLLDKGFVCEKSIFNKTYHTGEYSLNLKVEEKNDWFDLYGMVKFGEEEVPFVYLTENILNGNREYELKDGTIALIPEEWMTSYKDLFKFSHRKGREIKVRKFHYTLLSSLQYQSIRLPAFYKKSIERRYDLPELLQAELRPYQYDGFNWMMFLQSNRLGGCLADDMGLGKTLQALAILTHVHGRKQTDIGKNGNYFVPSEANTEKTGQLSLFSDSEDASDLPEREIAESRSSLIVMPLSLIHNWMEEIRHFSPSLRVYQHTGGGRTSDLSIFNRYDLILTTYGTVRNDIEMLEKYFFKYIILDESQLIKNASSRIFGAIKKLQSDHRLVLTGTPIENSLSDLWSQFAFINPGMLGSLSFFKKEFVTPVEKRNDDIAGQKLQKLVEPFILRRTKNQVAKELPPLSEKIHFCEMTPEQARYYETKKSQIRNAIAQSLKDKGEDKSRFFILSGLTRLRLIANHPAIIDQEYTHESGKFIEIKRNIEKLLAEDHKVLIFSQFVKYLNLFAGDFKNENLPFSLLTGKVAEKNRQEVIRNFQTHDWVRLFLISLKAGGVGLNLTGADYVFMLDPWWNPAIEQQAINRAHRIGQDKNVFVYKFITRNTVEEKILKLQQKKSDLASMFINDNNPLKSLSFEELSELI